jgi:hypothetical protein
MSSPLEYRMGILERAISAHLGIDLGQFDPRVVRAKEEAEAKANKEKADAEQAVREAEYAQALARREAEEKAEAAVMVRAQQILKERQKTKKA